MTKLHELLAAEKTPTGAWNTLQESVTVSGASPVVDVQSNAKQQVLTRDVLSAVPTSGTIQGLGQLVVGVTLNVPDVGGSRAMQQTYFAVRGQGGAQTVVLVDGMMTNGRKLRNCEARIA